MPVSMAIVCLIIGLTRPVRWKALECIDRTARTPSISRNQGMRFIPLTGAGYGTESSLRSVIRDIYQGKTWMAGGTNLSQTTLPGVGGP